MNWKPGDRALIISEESFLGMQCTVVRVSTDAYVQDRGKITIWPCAIRIHVDGVPNPSVGGWVAKPKWLRKIDDDYDGRNLSSWDECPFKPTSILLKHNMTDPPWPFNSVIR